MLLATRKFFPANSLLFSFNCNRNQNQLSLCPKITYKKCSEVRMMITQLSHHQFGTSLRQAIQEQNNQSTQDFPQQDSKIKFDYLYGINPVQIALNVHRRKFFELFVHDAQQENINPRVANILNLAKNNNLKVTFLNKQRLEKYCQHQPHQGVVLKCESLNYESFEATSFFLQQNVAENHLVVLTDQITDPQNFGAILRSCHYTGVSAVLVEDFSKCPLTPTVSKTSAGALEVANLYKVKQTGAAVEVFLRLGWKIIATCKHENGIELANTNEIIAPGDKVLVIIGSEGAGISDHLIKLAQHKIWIDYNAYRSKPLTYPHTLIDSLNANAAAAIILNSIARRIMK